MIKVRMVVCKPGSMEWDYKIPSRFMPHVPREGEMLLHEKVNFRISEVAWDLETEEVEAVLLLTKAVTN